MPPFGDDIPSPETKRKMSLIGTEGLARPDTSAVEIKTGRMFQDASHGESSKEEIALAL